MLVIKHQFELPEDLWRYVKEFALVENGKYRIYRKVRIQFKNVKTSKMEKYYKKFVKAYPKTAEGIKELEWDDYRSLCL